MLMTADDSKKVELKLVQHLQCCISHFKVTVSEKIKSSITYNTSWFWEPSAAKAQKKPNLQSYDRLFYPCCLHSISGLAQNIQQCLVLSKNGCNRIATCAATGTPRNSKHYKISHRKFNDKSVHTFPSAGLKFSRYMFTRRKTKPRSMNVKHFYKHITNSPNARC